MNQHQSNIELDWLLGGFAPISLDALNTKAEMLSRIDNKYLVQSASLQQVIPELSAHFDILEIMDRRIFTYDTCYFDDLNHSAYYEHHQGLRKGFKVRIRRYADANLCYLELKVKGKRGRTIKHRIPHNPKEIFHLTNEASSYASETYADHYGKSFDYNLKRTLDNSFKRITLVAKRGGERMTIDTDIKFRCSGKTLKVGTGVFVVEVKSGLGRGYADKCLRRVQERPTSRCSKYCIGMAALGEVSKCNRFLPAMRKLNLIKKMPDRYQWPVLSAA